jgi:hypothetical protein
MRFQLVVAVLAYAGAATASIGCCYSSTKGGCGVISTPEFKLRPVGEIVHPEVCCCSAASKADCATYCVRISPGVCRTYG